MKFGEVTLAKVRGPSDLRELLPEEIVSSETVIVKPNWFSPHQANYTTAEVLGMLLDALEGRVIVTEAYTLEKHDGSMELTVEGERVGWRWIMEHPDWDWALEGAWEELRRQDRWFLDAHGLTETMEDHGAEYLNVTEEVWSGRTANPSKVKERVEERYAPVRVERLYSCLPSVLETHKGAPLISLGKLKGIGGSYPSLTLKNLFGLIPDPLRSWWHGPEDRHLGESIIDTAKLYASHFDLYGVCEAIREATAPNPQGHVEVGWGRYDVIKDLGFAAGGRDLVNLDAVICGLIGVEPSEVSYLALGEKAFGAYDSDQVERARMVSGEWIPR
ncbi:MAG: DUF362 domain-containing protein [Candidatus Bathyarchaeota archaeon]|jgi:uncharacterized protein (DUF362 family)